MNYGCSGCFEQADRWWSTVWQRLIHKALKEGLGKRFTFHDLRAKAGSEAKDWRLLGHKDPHTFERIYKRNPVRIMNGVQNQDGSEQEEAS